MVLSDSAPEIVFERLDAGEEPLERVPKRVVTPDQRLNTWRNWGAMWLLGLLNNFAYVVILCGANALADHFGDDELTGVVTWANVAMGVAARLGNMYCLETSVGSRVSVVVLVFSASYVMLAASVHWSLGFGAAIFAIVCAGGSSALGESVMLGYLKRYPAGLVGGWSSGTGMAGVAGALFYLVMWLELKDELGCQQTLVMIYACIVPLPLLYLAVFHFGPSEKPVLEARHYALLSSEAGIEDSPGTEDGEPMATGAGGEEARVMQDEPAPGGSGARGQASCTRVFRQVWGTGANMFAVYFFEYVVSVGFAIRSPSLSENGSWWCTNGYLVLQMTYQCGVLLSRSSLALLRVKRVEIITALQAINFVGWWLNAQYHLLSSWMQVLWMAWVGLMGGMMYVNVFANLVDHPSLHHADREVAINIVSVAMNLGVGAAAFFQIMADHVFLRSQACAAAISCLSPHTDNSTETAT